ncbi:MAG: GNAT family N-acetyltransferase [Rhizobiaceae bacterium]
MTPSLRAVGFDERAIIAAIDIDPDQEDYCGGKIDDIFDRMKASPPRQHPFVLVDGDEAVAFIVAREGAALPVWAEKGCMSLHNLRVDRRFQGRGYGKSAMRLAGQWMMAERPAVTHVMSSVNIDNLPALRLNLACGMTPTGAIVEGRLGRERIMIAPVERLASDHTASISTRSL